MSNDTKKANLPAQEHEGYFGIDPAVKKSVGRLLENFFRECREDSIGAKRFVEYETAIIKAVRTTTPQPADGFTQEVDETAEMVKFAKWCIDNGYDDNHQYADDHRAELYKVWLGRAALAAMQPAPEILALANELAAENDALKNLAGRQRTLLNKAKIEPDDPIAQANQTAAQSGWPLEERRKRRRD